MCGVVAATTVLCCGKAGFSGCPIQAIWATAEREAGGNGDDQVRESRTCERLDGVRRQVKLCWAMAPSLMLWPSQDGCEVQCALRASVVPAAMRGRLEGRPPAMAAFLLSYHAAGDSTESAG